MGGVLDSPGGGEAFVAGVRTIEEKNGRHLDSLFNLAESVPQAESGLTAAFGWVSSYHLRSTVSELLSSPTSCRRRDGIAACALHGVDPLASLDVAIADPDATLRARALRTVGEIRRRHSLPSLIDALRDEDDRCRLRAAWSAVILGHGHRALQELFTGGLAAAAPDRARESSLAIQATEPQGVQEVLQNLAGKPLDLQLLIQGSGIAGDTVYVP